MCAHFQIKCFKVRPATPTTSINATTTTTQNNHHKHS